MRPARGGIGIGCGIALAIAALALGSAGAAPRVAAVALFKDMAMLDIDGREQLLRAGETTAEGVRLVRADAGAAVVEIGGERVELVLDERISRGFASVPAKPVVRLLPDPRGHYLADGQINGRAVRFLVDTGATGIVINRHTAERLSLDYRNEGRRGTLDTAGGFTDAYAVVFDEVKVHAIRLRGVRGVVVDGSAPRHPLLGQSFLNQVDIHREGVVLELHARTGLQ